MLYVEGMSAAATKAATHGFISTFVGVRWAKHSTRWYASIKHSRWYASIKHDGTDHHYLGYFYDEQEAARVFNEAARRLSPKGEAHGSRSGVLLHFPTAAEAAFAPKGFEEAKAKVMQPCEHANAIDIPPQPTITMSRTTATAVSFPSKLARLRPRPLPLIHAAPVRGPSTRGQLTQPGLSR